MSTRIESPILSFFNQHIVGPVFNRTLIIERMDCVVTKDQKINFEGKDLIVTRPEVKRRTHIEFIPR